MVIFYQKWKQYNGIQFTKNKMDSNNRKIKKSSTLPGLAMPIILAVGNVYFLKRAKESTIQYGCKKW